MSLPSNINEDVITSARVTWNKLSDIMDKNPLIFETNETFLPFYKEMVLEIFEVKETQ